LNLQDLITMSHVVLKNKRVDVLSEVLLYIPMAICQLISSYAAALSIYFKANSFGDRRTLPWNENELQDRLTSFSLKAIPTDNFCVSHRNQVYGIGRSQIRRYTSGPKSEWLVTKGQIQLPTQGFTHCVFSDDFVYAFSSLLETGGMEVKRCNVLGSWDLNWRFDLGVTIYSQTWLCSRGQGRDIFFLAGRYEEDIMNRGLPCFHFDPESRILRSLPCVPSESTHLVLVEQFLVALGYSSQVFLFSFSQSTPAVWKSFRAKRTPGSALRKIQKTHGYKNDKCENEDGKLKIGVPSLYKWVALKQTGVPVSLVLGDSWHY
jgi:hypothetical protein